jgi:tRNA(fMet)-specific endonuclease VapC
MRGTVTVVEAMTRHDPTDLALSSITSYELYTGVEKCADPFRERAKVDLLLSTLNQLAFDPAAALRAAKIRAALESRGEIIGPYDVLIVGHAMSQRLILVSANTNKFARVAGLAHENWQLAPQ